jgi:hypothetical protein
MKPTNDDLATVATFSNTAEAGLAKERLANEGVDAFVIEGMAGGMLPFMVPAMGGVHVQVRNVDLEKAREILSPSSDG